jgi:hypothetical protein
MRHHKKTYENVFSQDKKSSNSQFKIEKVSVGELGVDNYIKIFKEYLNDFFGSIFNGYVKLSWMRRKFSYCDLKTILPMYRTAPVLNLAFVKMMRRVIGKDIQIITRGKGFSKIETYFEDFFPGFMDGNPFENPDYYKFPYKNITLDFLMVVHEMDDRLELLDIADKEDMSYAVFQDYVINHAYSENEILGYNKYQINHNYDMHSPFYIRDIDKSKQTKKGRKRK